MMLDDTRCGLDASSLHWVTSMVNYKAKKFCLLSCHRDTSNLYFNKFLNICIEYFYSLFDNDVKL